MEDLKLELINQIINQLNKYEVEALWEILFNAEGDNPNYIKQLVGSEKYKELLENIKNYDN